MLVMPIELFGKTNSRMESLLMVCLGRTQKKPAKNLICLCRRMHAMDLTHILVILLLPSSNVQMLRICFKVNCVNSMLHMYNLYV